MSRAAISRERTMFSVRQKREIAEKVQEVLRETNHPELPTGEIQFLLHVSGATPVSWANIKTNGMVITPGVNRHNEAQDPRGKGDIVAKEGDWIQGFRIGGGL